jgi:hypothetical protein
MVLVAALCLLPGLPAKAQNYTFTLIAVTSSGFGAPSLNDAGVVAFSALLPGGTNGVFTGSGGSLTTIADTSGAFSGFSSPVSINNQGAVAFSAGLDAGGSGLFTGSGGPTTTIADTSGPFSSFSAPSLNNNGTVAFRASLDAGGSGIFTGSGGSVTTLYDTGPGSPFSDFLLSPSLSDAGTVAFRANLKAGGSGLFTGRGGPTTTVAANSPNFNFGNPGSPPSLNNEGTVAFAGARLVGPTVMPGIFTGRGGPTTFTQVSGFNVHDFPSLNDAGTMAFRAFTTNATSVGIFTGTNPAADRVITSGSPLFGSTVASLGLDFGPAGLNNAGQVAFRARLTNNTAVIVRADPVIPEPGTLTLLASAAVPGLGLALRRRRRA